MSNDPSAFINALLTLRQSRVFLLDSVPAKIVDEILEVGRWTGSAKNTQPWHLVVVEDAEARTAISEAGQYAGFLANAPLVIVIGLQSYSPLTEAYDGGRISERMMLAAAAHGLGSGTGWFTAEESQAKVRALLDIPEEFKVWSALGIGYADPAAGSPTGIDLGRKPLTEIVSYGRVGQER